MIFTNYWNKTLYKTVFFGTYFTDSLKVEDIEPVRGLKMQIR